MGRFAYVAPLLLFVPSALGVAVGGPWAWFLPVFAFGVLPVLEQLDRGSRRNLTPDEERAALADRLHDVVLWSVVPAQLLLLGAWLLRLRMGGLGPTEVLGGLFTMGIACAIFGINVGHELGHRRSPREQALAKVLLATSLYGHFFVEHNRGHHRRVATREDPASARLGETVYAFWWRSVTGGLRHAWKLEADRLAREGRGPWTWANETLRAFVVQATALALVGALLGPVALLGWVSAATIGFLLLETVNYVEHYGLERRRDARGVHERVRHAHSWTSNRPGGRIFLFELTRHADHHANAGRKYQVLRHFDDAPELPAGYPAMVLVALCPPLFFLVMDSALGAWSARHAGAVPAGGTRG